MKRYISIFAVMFASLLLLIWWNISVGSVKITGTEILAALNGSRDNVTAYNIIVNIRLPRLIAATVLGGALALAGYLLQSFFNNPIAGPYVLGVSSGAKLAVALSMIFFLSKGININSFGMVASAFVGAMISMGFVLIISRKIKNMSILVVCGILVGYICSAITDLCITFADDSNIVNLHNWALGSFSGMDWGDVLIMSAIVGICLVPAFLLSKPIGAYRMGENYAANMGVNIKALKTALIILASILAACVTAFAGPVSFVGIAVPHLVKTSMNTSKPIVLIPACFLGGAIVTLLCDGLARVIFAPTEVSISTVTSVLLVPVVIRMMIKKKSSDRG